MSDLGILIKSCDSYSDLWHPFFTLWWRYWPDCPYPVYLGANHKEWKDPRVKMILVGDDHSWGECTRKMVETFPHEYIMLSVEDYFLTKPIDTHRINELLRAFVQLNAGYLRLDPSPKPDRIVPGHPDIGEIDRGAPYRISLHISFWRRDVLLSLLRDGETVWDMELKGSRRSDVVSAGFFSTWEDVTCFDKGGVSRGKWTPSAISLARKEQLELDFSARSRLSPLQAIWRHTIVMADGAIGLIPWHRRRRLGDLLRRLKLLPSRADGRTDAEG